MKKIALVAVILSGSAHAFQPLVTDDTGTQGTGGNQIEVAATRAAVEDDRARDIGFVYTRGLTDALDVFIELGHQRIESDGEKVSGPTNRSIGAKWRFFENENKTSLALKPIYTFALSSDDEAKGLGTGKASGELSLILTQEMSWGAVHANVVAGQENYRDPDADTKYRSFSVAPVWNVNEQWKLAVDLGAIRSDTQGEVSNSRFGEVGVIYSPNGDLDFALGFIRENDRDADVVTKVATAGVTWRFK